MADLADSAERVRVAAAHWRLTVGEPLAGGTRSAVGAPTDQHGADVRPAAC